MPPSNLVADLDSWESEDEKEPVDIHENQRAVLESRGQLSNICNFTVTVLVNPQKLT